MRGLNRFAIVMSYYYLSGMNHGSLFSGIGGFDLAAQWMGWNNMFHCEINPFGRRVLNYYWPDAISYEDITKTDFTKHAQKIDVLSGGFPCQPYSIAGKRRGKEDDRHLWPAMLAAIKTIQPRWIVGENVHGIVNWSGGLVFHEIQTEMETAGYEVWSVILPACGINAPHRRDRTFFIAHANSLRYGGLQQEFGGKCEDKIRITGVSQASPTANPNGNGCVGSNSKNEVNPNKGGEYAFNDFVENSFANAPNTECEGLEGTNRPRRTVRFKQGIESVLSGFENFPTQSPICTGNDGISHKLDGITFFEWRRESIKSAGNAVVPPLAYKIFQTIQEYEQKV